MGFNKIIQLILIVLVRRNDVSSLTLHTGDVVVILQEDNSIILNCTYEINSTEEILKRDIRWQKKIGGEFRDLAFFSPPGGEPPFIGSDMQHLYDNRTKLIGPNTSLSAVMIIKDLVCSDEGTYRCWVEYFLGRLEEKENSPSVVEFESKAREPDEFVVFPNELQENQSISLTCSADVGTPRGNIQIWKFFNNSDIPPELIYTFNSTSYKTDNCTEHINMTITYTVTREDNGALFRCSSQNNLTLGPRPSKKSSRISVTYGPSITRIQASFSSSPAFIGDHVNMECNSDGNPNPNYTWKFNFTDVVSDAKYTFSADKSGLSFTITNITDSGYYQCVASSNINGKLFNSSSNVILTVQETHRGNYPSSVEQPCIENSCLIIENCVVKNGMVNCSLNIWSVIAFPFIALTFILCTMTISLVLSRNKQLKKENLKKGFNISDVHVSYTRETFDDFGGYADPKDVKRPENGQIKSDKDVRDNPYADPVDFQTQYAVVQKNWETPTKLSNDANSSNPSNLLNNTDLSNTGNPSGPPETTNPKNSSSNEKTTGSTETSETIPKPPNVYDDAWV